MPDLPSGTPDVALILARALGTADHTELEVAEPPDGPAASPGADSPRE